VLGRALESLNAAFASRMPLTNESTAELSAPCHRHRYESGAPESGHHYCLLDYGLLNLLPRQSAAMSERNQQTQHWLEFGVANGGSANFSCEAFNRAGLQTRLVGFDSFMGLPSAWQIPGGKVTAQGRFSQHGRVPPVRPCATLHKGLINETLPVWTHDHRDAHVVGASIDVDIYSASLEALTALHEAALMRRHALLHFHDLVSPYGRGDSRVYNTELLSPAFAHHPFRRHLLNQGKAMRRAFADPRQSWSEEQRAIFSFLRRAEGAEWWLVPLFDPSFVIPALFTVLH